MIGLKIILVQEEEWKCIVCEIYDGFVQMFVNLVFRMEIVERMFIKQDFKMVQVEIVDLKGQVCLSFGEMRKVIFNLCFMVLDDLGLILMFWKYVQDFEEKIKICLFFEMRGKEYCLFLVMEVVIYCFVQEGLFNVVKYVYFIYVVVEIIYQVQFVKIVVQDNGFGFKLEFFVKKSKDYIYFGLIGMREWVELLEGRIEIEFVEN